MYKKLRFLTVFALFLCFAWGCQKNTPSEQAASQRVHNPKAANLNAHSGLAEYIHCGKANARTVWLGYRIA